MFVQLFIAVVLIAVVNCFAPARFGARSQVSSMQMSMDKQVSKAFTAAIIAVSFMSGLPAIAVEGASPKQNFFGEAASSPFTFEETREDPIYSPYSPYGTGAAAVYNERKGGNEEISFWQNKLAVCVYVDVFPLSPILTSSIATYHTFIFFFFDFFICFLMPTGSVSTMSLLSSRKLTGMVYEVN